MKIKIVLLTALFLALSLIGFARSKTEAIAPNVIVKNLFAAQKAGSSPFFQTKVSAASQTQTGEPEAQTVQGELQAGKTESVILYVGMESGDYAAYCFTNDSEAGRAILAACKDREQCEVTGTVDHEGGCKVPGLEADLSESGKITKVKSVKALGRK